MEDKDIRIGIDADGGDIVKGVSSTERIVAATLMAAKQRSDVSFILSGNEKNILDFAHGNFPANVSVIAAVPANGVFGTVKGSSLNSLVNSVRECYLGGFYSIGNTARFGVESIRMRRFDGVKKPVLVAQMPSVVFTPEGIKFGVHVLADAGFNSGKTGEERKQDIYGDVLSDNALSVFGQGLMASVYAKDYLRLKKPRIGILTIGTEAEKGNDLTFRVDELFKQSILDRGLADFVNYVGRIESADGFRNNVDVILSEGHTGNIHLKSSEAVINLFKDVIKYEKENLTWWEKICCAPAKFVLDKKKNNFSLDPDRFNAALLLGCNGVAVKGHGNSGVKAILSGILSTADYAGLDFKDSIPNVLDKYVLNL